MGKTVTEMIAAAGVDESLRTKCLDARLMLHWNNWWKKVLREPAEGEAKFTIQMFVAKMKELLKREPKAPPARKNATKE